MLIHCTASLLWPHFSDFYLKSQLLVSVHPALKMLEKMNKSYLILFTVPDYQKFKPNRNKYNTYLIASFHKEHCSVFLNMPGIPENNFNKFRKFLKITLSSSFVAFFLPL